MVHNGHNHRHKSLTMKWIFTFPLPWPRFLTLLHSSHSSRLLFMIPSVEYVQKRNQTSERAGFSFYWLPHFQLKCWLGQCILLRCITECENYFSQKFTFDHDTMAQLICLVCVSVRYNSKQKYMEWTERKETVANANVMMLCDEIF